MQTDPLGDQALVFSLADEGGDVEGRVYRLAETLRGQCLPGVEDVVPAFDTLTVFYDPARVAGISRARSASRVIRDWVERVADGPGMRAQAVDRRVVEIPVVYGGEAGPDLARIAAERRLTPEELVARHAAASYEVVAVGFTPGFAYLGGLPAELRSPRLATPRVKVPAGSLGIGEAWTGIYPSSSPGGWNLIGRTSVRLFDAAAEPPNFLRFGDRVRFRDVTGRGGAA